VSAVLGTHPDLALIHGWGIGSAVWQPLIEPLASTWRVHLVDLPGYAGAAESSADFTATAQALIDHLPDGVTLCGWSLGAMLALRATLLAPQRVAGLLLVGATASFCQREGWSAAQAPELLDSFSESVRAEPQQTLQRFAALICQGDRQSRSLLRHPARLPAQRRAADERDAAPWPRLAARSRPAAAVVDDCDAHAC
jgi:pimeloyl-[acyl-carrier protein] methyl ester esterase